MPKALKNVIISHGGRHGDSAGTYLRGQVVPKKAAKLVPNELLAVDSQETFVRSGKRLRTDPKNRKAVSHVKNKAPEKPKPKVVGGKPDIPPPNAPPVVEEEAPKIDAPTSRRQVTVMRKANLVKLCEQEGLDTEGSGKQLKERIIAHFFGADD